MSKGEWHGTTTLINAALDILEPENPMTIRQLFYRLVSIGLLLNDDRSYDKVSRDMQKAREDGRCPWEWIVDRSRPEYMPNVFTNTGEYAETIKRGYRKDYWAMQPNHVEVWTEKDAIIGCIEPVTNELGVGVRVGRGYNSATKRHELEVYFGR